MSKELEDLKFKVDQAKIFLTFAAKEKKEHEERERQITIVELDLKRREKEVELSFKRLKYMELRLKKIVNEKRLDKNIEKLIEEATK